MATLGNHVRTLLFLGLLTGILLIVGQLVGGASGLFIALLLSIVMNVSSYYWSDKLVLYLYHAQPASTQKYHELHTMVENISHKAGIPKPKVYIIPTASPNAFATGRNPAHAAVACTQGILELLNKQELEGVIAHELAHVKNRDTLIQTIAATLAGVIIYIAHMAQWVAIFGGFGGRDNEGNNANPLQLLFLIIVTPLAATLLQLAISRSREFLADATGTHFIGTPNGLINALQKLHQGVKHHHMEFGNSATSSLFIINPFSGQQLLEWFSTHPHVDKRIAELKKLA